MSARGRALTGFAESLQGIESAWSLLEAGWSVTAFTRRGRRPPLRRCAEVEIVEVTPPEEDAAAAARDVLAAAAGAVGVLPLDDVAVWLCDAVRDELGIPVAGATGERARLALDKRRQFEAARGAGLAVPSTRTAASAQQLVDAPPVFPAVVKPALAVAEVGGRLVRGRAFTCADRGELERAVAGLEGVGPVLVQPLVRGVGEGLFGLGGPNGVRVSSAHRRVRMANPEGSGASACVAVPVDALLAERVERMLGDAQWRGMFMVELLRERKGTAWFMELNGRAWGSMALARRAGMEYPAWALAEALGEALPASLPPPALGLTARHAGREVAHLLSVMRGPRSRALVDWPSRRGSLRDVLRWRRTDRLYNWRRGDAAVWLDDTLHTALDPVVGRLRRR